MSISTLEEARDFFKNDLFATEVSGIIIEEVGEQYARCSMEITPKHLNAGHSVMGGAIFTLADFTFAVASNFNRSLTVTLDSQIRFLKAAKGTILYSEAKCTRETSKISFYTIDITDNEGIHVAQVTSTGYKK